MGLCGRMESARQDEEEDGNRGGIWFMVYFSKGQLTIRNMEQEDA